MKVKLLRLIRNRARAWVDGLFCSSSSDVLRVGDEHSGWVIKTGLPLRTVYCAGVGQGISFELELAQRASRAVIVMDPSPTGIATMATTPLDNIEFLPIGMADSCGVLTFSIPKDEGEGSFTVPLDGMQTVSFECWDLPRLMARSGEHAIDLLKMDIEGFEFAIVNKLLDEATPVRQLCVEFHPWLASGQMYKTLVRLYRSGYRIIHKHRGDYTLLLDERRFAILREQRETLAGQPVPAVTRD